MRGYFGGSPPALPMTVDRVSADVVRPLRTRVLRPAWTDRLATYPEDDASGTVHVAAWKGPDVVGVATVYPEAPPDAFRGVLPDAAYVDGAGWRLRGMATAPTVRGQGFGAAVLLECVEAIRAAGGTHLWCNARSGAVPFYTSLGLTAIGDEFDIPEIGPHYVMWRSV